MADTTDLSEINVELLPARTGTTSTQGPLGLKVNRRELIAFSLGVAAGAIAAFLGCLLALTRRERLPREEDDSARSKEP
ncbi:MAG TPA: hypothetical protein VFA18_11770 [Gemmataceae bacterium]|nr:hypothetical protein [Gemmataceae bacterium]